MPSPEGFQPQQAAQAEYSQEEVTCVRMELLITHLAAAQAVKLEQAGDSFAIDIPNRPQCWLIGKLDGDRIGVTRCQVDAEHGLAADLDMVFQITPTGWEPIEIVHTENAWDEFAQEMAAQRQAIFDTQGNFAFPVFADFWAQQLAQHVGEPLG